MSVKACFTDSIADWKAELNRYQHERVHVPWQQGDYKR